MKCFELVTKDVSRPVKRIFDSLRELMARLLLCPKSATAQGMIFPQFDLKQVHYFITYFSTISGLERTTKNVISIIRI